MTKAQKRLGNHRRRYLKNGGTTAKYAESMGLSPNRVGRLINGVTSAMPSIPEAKRIYDVTKIPAWAWLDPA